ncbi:propanol-preferring alcohol dehydrogenase [Haloactinospora alba]|uniref:alcohol dehydrogenase n=1 Tax=Haloactinospora alba TaxID=405555 RepID=A0A543NID5_9ACTN|nr:NAD(P)-dependent alcohol dehydrogenase [Haloactinospora alba]TQN31601.1 propanol-preferring alcohol dehydrogenase [Haloactinospora alba]
MRAVQYTNVGDPPRVTDVPVPEPGPGQLVLRVTAAGVCHSDLAVMSWPADGFPYPLPLTLGHEAAGRVEALGDGVHGVSEGESVVVYGPWGCGLCRNCSRGMENYCPHAGRLGIRPPGLGAPGALAEYLLVDAERHVVPIGGMDPVETVPLTDAGLTPYHVVKRSLDRLFPGSTAVVIGAGGLGHVAIQLLRAVSSATVVALDTREQSRELARQSGAHHVFPSNTDAAEHLRDLTGGAGADAVFDFVGAKATTDMASRMAGMDSDVNIVGIADGSFPVSFGSVPFGTRAAITYWGGRPELIELIDLAARGAVSVEVQRFSLEDGPRVYERMRSGDIHGRAVIVPGA